MKVAGKPFSEWGQKPMTKLYGPSPLSWQHLAVSVSQLEMCRNGGMIRNKMTLFGKGKEPLEMSNTKRGCLANEFGKYDVNWKRTMTKNDVIGFF